MAWYELDDNCTVLLFSRVGAVTAGEPGRAETGVTIDPALVVGGIAASTLGLGLLLLARRRNDAHANYQHGGNARAAAARARSRFPGGSLSTAGVEPGARSRSEEPEEAVVEAAHHSVGGQGFPSS
jgi:LPXTG-motif cell wall-anchored protein